MPYVIEALGDVTGNANLEYLYSMVKTLYYITGEKPIVAYQLFLASSDTRAEFLRFWKQWAVEHQDELKHLRIEAVQ